MKVWIGSQMNYLRLNNFVLYQKVYASLLTEFIIYNFVRAQKSIINVMKKLDF